jgi:hypothetical protein
MAESIEMKSEYNKTFKKTDKNGAFKRGKFEKQILISRTNLIVKGTQDEDRIWPNVLPDDFQIPVTPRSESLRKIFFVKKILQIFWNGFRQARVRVC